MQIENVAPGQIVRIEAADLPAHNQAKIVEVLEVRELTARSLAVFGKRVYNRGRSGEYYGSRRQAFIVKRGAQVSA